MALSDEALPLACSTLAYAGSPLETALQGIGEAGFRHVELAAMPGYCDHLVLPGESESETVARAERVLRDAGLNLISLSAHIDLVPAPPGHLPGFAAAEALQILLARVRLAGALGASVVNTQGANPSSPVDEEAFLSRLEIVAEVAQRCGVVLALEVADGLTASADSIQALMPKLRGAPVAINYDTGNLPFYSGLDPLREYGPVHEFVAHIHLKDHLGGVGDYNFPALGEGELDLAGFVALVKRLGYAGPLSAEIEFRHPTERPAAEVVTRAARTSLDAMRAYLAAA